MTFQLLEGDDDAECADAGEEWNFSKTRCRRELGGARSLEWDELGGHDLMLTVGASGRPSRIMGSYAIHPSRLQRMGFWRTWACLTSASQAPNTVSARGYSICSLCSLQTEKLKLREDV